MSTSTPPTAAGALAGYRRDVTSQWGEDGIIAEIFRRIGVQSRLCVEFGAWDGKYLSNTWDLWHNHGWRAILIEGDPSKHAELSSSVSAFPGVRAHCAYVAAEGETALDAILDRLGVESPPDLLSIDIDGDDYWVLAAIERFLPRVLVVEYNPTIPPELEITGRPGTRFGSSARAILRLAAGKGYRLAACTITNLLLVQERDFPALGLAEPALEEVMPRDHLTYVITDYDGRPFLSRQPTYARPCARVALRPLVARALGRQAPAPSPPDGDLLPVEIYKA